MKNLTATLSNVFNAFIIPIDTQFVSLNSTGSSISNAISLSAANKLRNKEISTVTSDGFTKPMPIPNPDGVTQELMVVKKEMSKHKRKLVVMICNKGLKVLKNWSDE